MDVNKDYGYLSIQRGYGYDNNIIQPLFRAIIPVGSSQC